MLWLHLLLGLFVFGYFTFSVGTVYMFLVGKVVPGTEQVLLGKLIKWHGAATILVLVAVSVLTLAFVFCFVLLRGLGMLALPLS